MTESSEKISDKNSTKRVKFGFGPHLVLDGYDADVKRLSSLQFVYGFLDKLPEVIGMHKITPPYVFYYDGGDKPEDDGITGFVIIAESHISIHTYPHKKFLTADVYSCKEFDTETAAQTIIETFSVSNFNKRVIRRGKEFPQTEQALDQDRKILA
ncbi:S-adenosylmethionine decarboxylase [Candidatus Woesearchaeota archaeon]|nr:S-adenosylmethionine decarboxylase [Candidatus Woesearchaeota archaeon]